MTSSSIWKKLSDHANNMKYFIMADEFKTQPQRTDKMSLSLNGLHLDFSKNIINAETLNLFSQLCEQIQLREKINAMFEGKKINYTEKRRVLHTALRTDLSREFLADNENISKKVKNSLDNMFKVSNQILEGEWLNENGKTIENIVNIGIGGSDLGPHMVCEALKPFCTGKVNCFFVSNVDGTHLVETIKHLSADRTLFIIASKTFTTLETLSNAHQAKEWLLSNGVKDVSKHMIAVSSAPQKAKDFGINTCLEMFDWVGGRYSLWSTIGLSIALYIGPKNFQRLLEGARCMDEHFRQSAWQENMPVIMACLGLWYQQYFDAQSYAVIPYYQYLHLFCDFLQQLDMESNGKFVNKRGDIVAHHTGPIIWGGLGTNSQHAFHQLLHQGTHFIPVDFIACIKSHNSLGMQNAMLYANCLSQSQALLLGKSKTQALQECLDAGMNDTQAELIAKHKMMPGNRPSNTIVMQDCDPFTLGMLIALYEHKVFVQAALWDINAFDQWGVELGKQITKDLLPILTDGKDIADNCDASTRNLLKRFLA